MNIEIWDKNIFKTVCPGKDKECGGWDHWVKALEYAVKVFGFGKVSSNIVSGIEPKESILQGVEYLASKGVICLAGVWRPSRGSSYEGHQSPTVDWHYDLTQKVTNIYRKAGFKYKEHLYRVFGHPTLFYHDIYNIEDERLPIFKQQQPLAAVS
jgi:hypothetical protein